MNDTNPNDTISKTNSFPNLRFKLTIVFARE